MYDVVIRACSVKEFAMGVTYLAYQNSVIAGYANSLVEADIDE